MAVVALALPSPAHGQTPEAGSTASTQPSSTTTAQPASDDDERLDPAEPDFVVINLPTTLRLPRHKGDFHLTHRFEGNLRDGSFTDQLSNFFGVDVGAALGLEYRFGVMRHLRGDRTAHQSCPRDSVLRQVRRLAPERHVADIHLRHRVD